MLPTPPDNSLEKNIFFPIHCNPYSACIPNAIEDEWPQPDQGTEDSAISTLLRRLKNAMVTVYEHGEVRRSYFLSKFNIEAKLKNA